MTEDPFAPPPTGSVPPARPLPEYGAPLPSPSNGFGVAALVLGILSVLGVVTVVLGLLLGVLAVVFGALGRGRARRGEATNGGAALAGIITGAVAIVLSGALVAVGVALFTGSSGRQLRDCLTRAGSDSSAVTACQEQFRRDVTGR